MPYTKRDKRVYLSKTQKTGLNLKQKVKADVRNCLNYYDNVYLFKYNNITKNHLKFIRNKLIKSRLFFRRNEFLIDGLGRCTRDEAAANTHKLSLCMNGTCGLFFTNRKKYDVLNWFNNFNMEDYVVKTVELKKGPLKDFLHSIEPYVRQLGLPTKLDNGIVMLTKDHVVCKKGDVLTPEQAKLLQLLGHQLEKFRLKLIAMWTKPGIFEKLCEQDADEEESNEEMEESDDE